MIAKEYLKLARSFNSFLTGISPVMGAIAMGYFELSILIFLFIIGFFGHTYGFVINDIFDYKIDKQNKDLSDRPLVSGTISIKKAWLFAIFSITISFIIAMYIAYSTQKFFPLIILLLSAIIITIYDKISKRYPLMDIFDSLAVFLLILYGATIVTNNLSDVTQLAWLVCILGGIQVLFMQVVPGGLKDIENDYKTGANTIAVSMGVRVSQNGFLKIPIGFKTLAYLLQMINIGLVFLPFIIVFRKFSTLYYVIWTLLVIISLLMLFVSYRFLTMKYFKRDKMRKLLGSHFSINFALVPIMLMALNPWAILIVLFPPIGFIASNLVLHGTLLQPQTM